MDISVVGKLSSSHQPYLLAAAQQAVADLPAPIRKILNATVIVLARRLIDINPSLTDEMARGWRGKTFDFSEAYHDMYRGLIGLAQEHRDSSHGRYVCVRRNQYHALLHEIGHAFDIAMKSRVSSSAAMRQAYELDIAALDSLDTAERDAVIEDLDYFLTTSRFGGSQPSEEAARKEVFAEAFADIIGGLQNCDAVFDAPRRQSRFAHCYAVIEEFILKIAPDAKLYPAHDRSYPSRLESSFLCTAFACPPCREKDVYESVALLYSTLDP